MFLNIKFDLNKLHLHNISSHSKSMIQTISILAYHISDNYTNFKIVKFDENQIVFYPQHSHTAYIYQKHKAVSELIVIVLNRP